MIGFRVGDEGVGVGGLISPTHRCLCLLGPMHLGLFLHETRASAVALVTGRAFNCATAELRSA